MWKVKPILYMLGKGGISVLQTAILFLVLHTCTCTLTFDIIVKIVNFVNTDKINVHVCVFSMSLIWFAEK